MRPGRHPQHPRQSDRGRRASTARATGASAARSAPSSSIRTPGISVSATAPSRPTDVSSTPATCSSYRTLPVVADVRERSVNARQGADAMLAVLEAVQQGALVPADALARIGELPFRELGFARVDTHRELRQGAPEAILAEGKTPDEIEAIARALLESDAGSVLVTPLR